MVGKEKRLRRDVRGLGNIREGQAKRKKSR